VVFVTSVPSIIAVMMVTVVHEEVHQRAGREKQIWQDAEDVRRVFRQQKEPGDGQETAEHDPGRSAPPRRLSWLVHHKCSFS